jgi:hypothetical protein
MEKGENKYIPVSREMHDLLLQMYDAAMTKSPEESKLWCERLTGVLAGWRAAKMGGVFPGFLVVRFHEDITHVMGVVHKKVKVAELAEHQQVFPFNMATLQSEFRGK